MVKRVFHSFGFLLASACIAGLMPLSGEAFAAQFGASQPGAPQIGSSLSAPSAAAQGGTTIAAVVNEEIITVFDVQSRMSLVIATSGFEDTPDIRRRLTPQVIDALIDERLKSQEAARLKLKVTDAEIRQSVEGIEQRNNMTPGSFRALLASKGIDPNAVNAQIEAEIGWSKVVRQTFERAVNVSQDEVNAVLLRAKANQGKPEFQVAEISLPVTSSLQDQTMRDLANRLVLQARGGTPFPALAQQFSQSPTAVLGGDLGWVVRGELEPELDDVIARLEPNQISDPIRTATGYHILSLRDRRISGAADPNMAVVTLSQIFLPTVGGRAFSAQRLAQLSSTIGGLTSCDQMNKLATELETPGSGPIPPVFVGSLPDKVRDAVVNLTPGHTSHPVEVGGARLFLQVCLRRNDPGVPGSEQISNTLENEKLQNLARQKLRDLRRQALIDVRM